MQRFIIVRRQVVLEQKLVKQLIESMLKSCGLRTDRHHIYQIVKETSVQNR